MAEQAHTGAATELLIAEGSVRVSAVGGVATLQLDRASRHNAVDRPMAAAMRRGVAAVAARDDLSALVIAAAGPTFCAGWDVDDLREMRERHDPDRSRADFVASRRLLDEIAALPQVSIVAVQGAVIGFGVCLLCRADFAIATTDATVSTPEIAHGVVPSVVMQDLLEAIGRRRARRWLLAGEKLGAEEALAAGLFSELVETSRLGERVARLAARFTELDQPAIRCTKRLLREVPELSRDDAAALLLDQAVEAIHRQSG